MVAPLIPRLSGIFGVSGQTFGLIVPAYMIPYGVSTLFYGLLSDRLGRRPILLASLSVFVALTALTATAQSASQMILLKAYFLDLAVRRKAGTLEQMIAGLPFEPYAPVRRQLLNLVRAMNKARKVAGFESLSFSCVRMKRCIVRPFAARGSLAMPEKPWYKQSYESLCGISR
jgi:fucose permease